MVTIKVLPADYGDCIVVSIRENLFKYNILIDGGLKKCYSKFLKNEIEKICAEDEVIDLVINTHVDSDHILGLIALLEDSIENKKIKIDKIWHNGFDQIISEARNSENNNIDKDDLNIIKNLNEKGYELNTDELTDISVTDNLSFINLAMLGVKEKRFTLNDESITADKSKYKLADGIYINIINPSNEKLKNLENEWKKGLYKKEFRFTHPKNQELKSSFEYLISRIKEYYTTATSNISNSNELSDYATILDNVDKSVVNDSSIAFVLEVKEFKFLFLGDSIIRDKENCEITKLLIYEYGEGAVFDGLKLPHHGSDANISNDFIDLFEFKNIFISTNSERYSHPSINVLANLAIKNNKIKFIFNYPIEKAEFINKDEWKEKYNYSTLIGDGNSIVQVRWGE